MFDLNAFRAASLSPRQATVSVPDLQHFFPDGATAEWTVRGLTGEEIARANDSSARYQIVAAAIAALAASSAAKEGQVEAMQSLLGYGTEVPEDLAKRLDHLVFGSVTPVIDRDIAVRIFSAFPMVGYQLTNKILELTGLGADLGKVPLSTASPASVLP
jgi:hypothetical protein